MLLGYSDNDSYSRHWPVSGLLDWTGIDCTPYLSRCISFESCFYYLFRLFVLIGWLGMHMYARFVLGFWDELIDHCTLIYGCMCSLHVLHVLLSCYQICLGI